MIEPPENCNGPDGDTSAELQGCHRSRNSLVDALVRTARVEAVKAVLLKHMRKVASPDNGDVV
jgi:hypothetical protein